MRISGDFFEDFSRHFLRIFENYVRLLEEEEEDYELPSIEMR